MVQRFIIIINVHTRLHCSLLTWAKPSSTVSRTRAPKGPSTKLTGELHRRHACYSREQRAESFPFLLARPEKYLMSDLLDWMAEHTNRDAKDYGYWRTDLRQVESGFRTSTAFDSSLLVPSGGAPTFGGRPCWCRPCLWATGISARTRWRDWRG